MAHFERKALQEEEKLRYLLEQEQALMNHGQLRNYSTVGKLLSQAPVTKTATELGPYDASHMAGSVGNNSHRASPSAVSAVERDVLNKIRKEQKNLPMSPSLDAFMDANQQSNASIFNIEKAALLSQRSKPQLANQQSQRRVRSDAVLIESRIVNPNRQ